MNGQSVANAYEKPVTLKNILRFALPTIAISLFMSFYTMVDGLFVSNLIGTNALSAIDFFRFIYPFTSFCQNNRSSPCFLAIWFAITIRIILTKLLKIPAAVPRA